MGYEEKGSGMIKFWGFSYVLGANERESYKPAIVKLVGPVISSSSPIGQFQEGAGQHTLPQDRCLSFFDKLLKCRDVQSVALNLFGDCLNFKKAFQCSILKRRHLRRRRMS